jgi:hypothetical protein
MWLTSDAAVGRRRPNGEEWRSDEIVLLLDEYLRAGISSEGLHRALLLYTIHNICFKMQYRSFWFEKL